jgi:hypothetical protein
MATQIAHDDPNDQEPLGRRYAWATLEYVMFAAMFALLFLMVR